MIKGFKDFLLRGNVVDLAVAVIIGAAFGTVVKSFSDHLISPIFALIGGKPDFGGLILTIGKAEFKYGIFLTDLLSFVITAAVVYFVVVVPVGKMLAAAAKPEADAPEAPSRDQELLTEIRDLLAARNAS